MYRLILLCIVTYTWAYVYVSDSVGQEQGTSSFDDEGVVEQEANDKDLITYVLKNDILFNWDTFLGLGLLTKNKTTLSFSLDTPYVLIDFETIATVMPPTIKDGVVFVSDSFIAIVERELLDSSTTRKTNTAIDSSYYEQFRISTIIIDPGHGGKDSGAVGIFSPEGTTQSPTVQEKNVVLKSALLVGDLLKEAFPAIKIVYTRDSDVFLSLEARANVANGVLESLPKDEATLFISIHANGSLKKNANGMEVWTLPPDYARSNLVDVELDEKSLAYGIINTIRDQEISIESQQLAEYVLADMYESLGGIIRNRGIKQEKWYVVRNARMPAILIELGFVTNKSEATLLNDNDVLTKLANGIARGISNYIELFQAEAQ